jgi:hypothetical protein
MAFFAFYHRDSVLSKRKMQLVILATVWGKEPAKGLQNRHWKPVLTVLAELVRYSFISNQWLAFSKR